MRTNVQIREAVITGIRKVMRRPSFTLNDTDAFQDQGLDSLDRMSLLLEVEETLGMALEGLNPAKITCIKDYIDILAGASNCGAPTDGLMFKETKTVVEAMPGSGVHQS